MPKFQLDQTFLKKTNKRAGGLMRSWASTESTCCACTEKQDVVPAVQEFTVFLGGSVQQQCAQGRVRVSHPTT